ncbi:MAG: hypothetical protein ABL986_02675 [Vicinamibacterales bacterium]
MFHRLPLCVSSAGLLLALTASPALAQVDFSGEWAPVYHEDGPERLPGPELGDYLGLPLNAAARLRADSWDGDRISVVMEYQCRPHSSDYGMRGLGNLRVSRELDPQTHQLTTFRTYMPAWGSERTVWMDGRPHPAALAEHTFQGFSTGRWEGNTLVIETTHLKANYFRRNGVASSDQRTMTEYWTRHRDLLTVVTVQTDPVMLDEPLVRSQNWYLDPGQQLRVFLCESVLEVPTPGSPVPHHLFGTNRFLNEVADFYGLPLEATRGGAATMYPEYRKTMGAPRAPAPNRCERFCTCTDLFDCQLRDTTPRTRAVDRPN